jgi:hypothetical protein
MTLRRHHAGLVFLLVLGLAACGGTPHSASPPAPRLPRAVASSLAQGSDAIATALAAGDSCRAATLAHQLQQQTIAAINAGRVPAALQEQLSGSVNDLAGRIVCVPPPPPEKHEHGKHKGHDKQDQEQG